MALAFFGLTPNDKEIYLEPTFLLMYYSGFSYSECMSLPVWQRRWFIDRVVKEIKDAKGANRGTHDNDDNSRAMSGYNRSTTPSKLRRFT